jgi:hypothetical protein
LRAARIAFSEAASRTFVPNSSALGDPAQKSQDTDEQLQLIPHRRMSSFVAGKLDSRLGTAAKSK